VAKDCRGIEGPQEDLKTSFQVGRGIQCTIQCTTQSHGQQQLWQSRNATGKDCQRPQARAGMLPTVLHALATRLDGRSCVAGRGAGLAFDDINVPGMWQGPAGRRARAANVLKRRIFKPRVIAMALFLCRPAMEVIPGWRPPRNSKRSSQRRHKDSPYALSRPYLTLPCSTNQRRIFYRRIANWVLTQPTHHGRIWKG
jgi:hypothetical protein